MKKKIFQPETEKYQREIRLRENAFCIGL